MVGILGNVLILGSFVLCIGTVFAYYRATNDQRAGVESNWLRLGRLGWTLSTTMLFGASGLLWYLLFTHDFSYYYVWKNTSLDLPPYYLISSLWAGQEGSFMVWMMFTGLTGWGVIKYGRHLEAPSMAVIAFCQMFMISMIVGLQFGSVPIGSDPFKLLTTHFPDAPFLQNGGTPPDGNGLNDLLKNPWMAIHPPTMFIGFALMIVPFAYAIAGLWTRDYSSWVKPALPWALFSAMMLGSGLLMGGYWAYVTLSFGGYWAWDPVENSSLVPWLIGVAAIHTMLAQKRSGQSYKASILLNIIAYMLVVYSTFLTRSGILGDISVHSFVDLGLNNQLLLWILSMGAIGFGLYIKRYKELPTPKKEPALLSREFMIFSGAMLLCAISLVIILGTSAPIFGRIFRDNPSGVPIEFYNKWSLPITAVIAFLIGLGQLFWWNRMKVENVNKVLLWPLVASVAGTVLILVVTPFA
ncbi:MAG: cytochrome c biogenesis protein CcsA, partial [Bacteroidota bacterium]